MFSTDSDSEFDCGFDFDSLDSGPSIAPMLSSESCRFPRRGYPYHLKPWAKGECGVLVDEDHHFDVVLIDPSKEELEFVIDRARTAAGPNKKGHLIEVFLNAEYLVNKEWMADGMHLEVYGYTTARKGRTLRPVPTVCVIAWIDKSGGKHFRVWGNGFALRIPSKQRYEHVSRYHPVFDHMVEHWGAVYPDRLRRLEAAVTNRGQFLLRRRLDQFATLGLLDSSVRDRIESEFMPQMLLTAVHADGHLVFNYSLEHRLGIILVPPAIPACVAELMNTGLPWVHCCRNRHFSPLRPIGQFAWRNIFEGADVFCAENGIAPYSQFTGYEHEYRPSFSKTSKQLRLWKDYPQESPTSPELAYARKVVAGTEGKFSYVPHPVL